VNIFNRIVMVVLLLVLIVLVALMLIRPDIVSDAATRSVNYVTEGIRDNWFYQWFLLIGGAVLLLLLVLLVLELRKPRRKLVRIKTQEGGTARMDISSVAQSIENRVDELAGVRKVKTRITSRGKNVDVAVDLDTSPSVNIPVLTDQIIALTHDIVEGQLGIQIHRRPVINIKHEPYPRGTMPSTKPLPPEPVAPTPPTIGQTRPETPSYGANLGLGEALAKEEQEIAQAAEDQSTDYTFTSTDEGNNKA